MGETVITQMAEFDHEQVIYFQNKDVGLQAIIAIHNTTLGPALGGTRMYPYANEKDALYDVLRLSRGMTYKAAASGLSLGGGKSVIIGDPKKDKSQSLFAAFGRFINTLGGRYIAAEDVGTDVNDIEYMYGETDYVVGIAANRGGSGDPSPYTAMGVFQGITACCSKKFGDESLKGKTVVVQGIGHVGSHLVRMLVEAGAKVSVADVDAERIQQICKEFPVQAIGVNDAVKAPCDIFAPCALGAVINGDSINQLKCQIIAGAANNQLDVVERAEQLREMGILYAPDYVINAGGLMNVYLELEGYNQERAERMTRGIYYNLVQIFEISDNLNMTTALAANHMVEQRLKMAGRSANVFSPMRKDPLKMIHSRRTTSLI